MANQNPLATNLTLEQQKNLFGNAYLNMLWHCPTDLRFHYWVHLPDYYYDEEEHEYSLLVIIHGTGCAVQSKSTSSRRRNSPTNIIWLCLRLCSRVDSFSAMTSTAISSSPATASAMI